MENKKLIESIYILKGTLTEEEYKEVLENSVYCKPLIVRKMGIFCTILLSILLLVTLIVLIF